MTEAARALSAAIAGEPYALYRRHGRPEIRAALETELASSRPDVLYLDHLDSFQFAPRTKETPIVIDLHNIYSLIASREARDPARSWIMRRVLAREGTLLARREGAAVAGVDAVFSVSERERAYFAGLNGAPVHLVPNGVDCAAYSALPAGRSCAPPTILFIGTMSWPPNAAAARFLATDVLPRVQATTPDAALRIVGRDPGSEVRALSEIRNVTVTGSVPDIIPHVRDASVLAVPLDAGGGTRLKILEAFAAGLPVVSTAIGCEGIDCRHDRELLVAERPAFADTLASLLADPARGEPLALRARALARSKYDWPVVAHAARTVVTSIVNPS